MKESANGISLCENCSWSDEDSWSDHISNNVANCSENSHLIRVNTPSRGWCPCIGWVAFGYCRCSRNLLLAHLFCIHLTPHVSLFEAVAFLRASRIRVQTSRRHFRIHFLITAAKLFTPSRRMDLAYKSLIIGNFHTWTFEIIKHMTKNLVHWCM